jgi:hypothetical protein
MPFMKADPISHSGGYAENIDKSGLIRGIIVEESLMGRNAVSVLADCGGVSGFKL